MDADLMTCEKCGQDEGWWRDAPPPARECGWCGHRQWLRGREAEQHAAQAASECEGHQQ